MQLENKSIEIIIKFKNNLAKYIINNRKFTQNFGQFQTFF